MLFYCSLIHWISLFFFYFSGYHRDLHVLTHSFPPRRSSDLREGEPVRLRRSQYIVRRGERPHSRFLIQEGWAARYRILRDGRRHISQFYTPGDVCDSSWLLSGEAGHSVLALTPLRGVALDREAAELRFGRDAEFSRRVASESLSRLEAQAEWMVTLGCKSARERMGQLILELYIRARKRTRLNYRT